MESAVFCIVDTTSVPAHAPPPQRECFSTRERPPSPVPLILLPMLGQSVNVVPSGGFTGNVSFSVSGLPQGANASFNPSSVTTSGSSTLTISTLASTAPGSYTLTITATSGTLVHTAKVTLVVSVPSNFAISVAPTNATVNRGSSTTYTATITGQGGFAGTVNFSVSGLPRRTSASFSPSSVVGSGTSVLSVSANRKVLTGAYPLTITATSGGRCTQLM